MLEKIKEILIRFRQALFPTRRHDQDYQVETRDTIAKATKWGFLGAMGTMISCSVARPLLNYTARLGLFPAFLALECYTAILAVFDWIDARQQIAAWNASHAEAREISESEKAYLQGLKRKQRDKAIKAVGEVVAVLLATTTVIAALAFCAPFAPILLAVMFSWRAICHLWNADRNRKLISQSAGANREDEKKLLDKIRLEWVSHGVSLALVIATVFVLIGCNPFGWALLGATGAIGGVIYVGYKFYEGYKKAKADAHRAIRSDNPQLTPLPLSGHTGGTLRPGQVLRRPRDLLNPAPASSSTNGSVLLSLASQGTGMAAAPCLQPVTSPPAPSRASPPDGGQRKRNAPLPWAAPKQDDLQQNGMLNLGAIGSSSASSSSSSSAVVNDQLTQTISTSSAACRDRVFGVHGNYVQAMNPAERDDLALRRTDNMTRRAILPLPAGRPRSGSLSLSFSSEL